MKLPKLRKLDRPAARGHRVSAVLALLVGTFVTLAINVLHAEPSFWPRLLSASVPVILFLTLHTAAYADSWLVRFLMGPVALVAFTVSFDHMNGYAMLHGENYHVAKLYPLFIDGALVVATIVLSLNKTPSLIETKAPIDEEEDEAPDEIQLTHEDLMLVLWPDNALSLVTPEEKTKVVRSQLNRKCRELGMKEVGESRTKTLIRTYEEEFVK